MRHAIVCLLILAASACVPKPKKKYTPDEVASIDSLEEIMRVQADRMDPLFSIREQEAFSAEEFTKMSHAADVLEETSKRLADKFAGTGSYDDGFAELANKQGEMAVALRKATEDNSAKRAREALEAMKNNCNACHGVYR